MTEDKVVSEVFEFNAIRRSRWIEEQTCTEESHFYDARVSHSKTTLTRRETQSSDQT